MKHTDFSTITESPENKVIPIQVERAFHRYAFALPYIFGKDVLEVACGVGQGLGMLAQKAKHVTAVDIEKKNLDFAKKTYSEKNNIKILEMDAMEMSFGDQSFDAILIYETIYYLSDISIFLRDCKRMLRSGGTLIICTANKNWHSFNPSPLSKQYYNPVELRKLAQQHGFFPTFFGAFPDKLDSVFHLAKFIMKIGAVRFNLMPKTMKGKVLLKNLFFGPLVPYPAELRINDFPYHPPEEISAYHTNRYYTAIYAVFSLL